MKSRIIWLGGWLMFACLFSWRGALQDRIDGGQTSWIWLDFVCLRTIVANAIATTATMQTYRHSLWQLIRCRCLWSWWWQWQTWCCDCHWVIYFMFIHVSNTFLALRWNDKELRYITSVSTHNPNHFAFMETSLKSSGTLDLEGRFSDLIMPQVS